MNNQEVGRQWQLTNIINVEAFGGGAEFEIDDPDEVYEVMASWPHGIETAHIFRFAGFTVLGGAHKIGKSQVALRSAIEAAAAGWQVLFVNLENSKAIHSQRRASILAQAGQPDWLSKGMTTVHGFEGLNVYKVAAFFSQLADDPNKNHLLVIDLSLIHI